MTLSTLLNKESLEGEVYVNLPQGASRAKDYFNQDLTFYALLKGETVFDIHRSFILTVQDRLKLTRLHLLTLIFLDSASGFVLD